MRKIYILLVMIMVCGLTLQAREYVSVKASGIAVTGQEERVWTTSIATDEAGRNSVLLSRTDDFQTWKSDTLNIDNCIEAVLWSAPTQELMMFYSTMDGYIRTKVCADPLAVSPVWTEGTDLGRGPWKCTSPPVVSQGNWILSVAFQKGVFTLTSADNGKTWTRGKIFIKVPDKVSGDNNPVMTSDGQKISIYMRTTGTTHCYRAQSFDNGLTWNAPEAFMPNPDRDISFERLPDGRLLMVKCSRFDHNVHVASQRVIAYLSDDDGQTWYGGLVAAGGRKAVDPKVSLGSGGCVYIYYTHDAQGEPQTRISRTTVAKIEKGTVWEEVWEKDIKTVDVAMKAVEAGKLLTSPKTEWAERPLKVATWNIQYLAKKPSWKEFRLPAIFALLQDYDFDVFGSQEPYLPQIEDMMEGIGDRYAWIGECTGDKDSRKTHYNPIFYKKERLEILEWGSIPFSETAGTIGFGAMYARNCTWAKFRDLMTGKEFYFFNSHFDHQGVEAREVSAEILVAAVRKIAAGYPAFLTGDFNSDEKTLPYKLILKSGFIDDTMTAVQNPQNVEYFSMSRYKSIDTVKKTGTHIDHVFYTPNSVKVNSWKLILDSYDGKFGSDHLPIMAEVLIAN
jgi:endonuclease/exonuclease/phosphatase family metal-dependent hydrolase